MNEKEGKWENTIYKSLVRISKECVNYLRDIKGKRTLAKTLEDIIIFYKDNHK
jgi:hypothetical protein